jgi:hypothetical protein
MGTTVPEARGPQSAGEGEAFTAPVCRALVALSDAPTQLSERFLPDRSARDRQVVVVVLIRR